MSEVYRYSDSHKYLWFRGKAHRDIETTSGHISFGITDVAGSAISIPIHMHVRPAAISGSIDVSALGLVDGTSYDVYANATAIGPSGSVYVEQTEQIYTELIPGGGATLQQITDNGATTTNTVTFGNTRVNGEVYIDYSDTVALDIPKLYFHNGSTTDASYLGFTQTGNSFILVNNAGYSPLNVGAISAGLDRTDYTEIAANGTITLHGAATVWEDLRVPVNATKKGESKPPTEGAFLTTFIIEWFSASAENELFFTVQLPHNYKEGTDLKPHVHWTPSNTDTGTVVWLLDYSWANIDGTFPGSAQIPLSDVGSGTVGDHQLTASGTLTGTSKTISSMVVCRISRDGGAGTDDFTGTAGLLEIDFHYEIDSLGSNLELTK